MIVWNFYLLLLHNYSSLVIFHYKLLHLRNVAMSIFIEDSFISTEESLDREYLKFPNELIIILATIFIQTLILIFFGFYM